MQSGRVVTRSFFFCDGCARKKSYFVDKQNQTSFMQIFALNPNIFFLFFSDRYFVVFSMKNVKKLLLKMEKKTFSSFRVCFRICRRKTVEITII